VSVNSGSKTGKKKGTKRKSTELVEMIEKNQQNGPNILLNQPVDKHIYCYSVKSDR
jgi:hypothetical protein